MPNDTLCQSETEQVTDCLLCGTDRYDTLYGLACEDCAERVFTLCEDCMEPVYTRNTYRFWLPGFALAVSEVFPQFGNLYAIRDTATAYFQSRPELWQSPEAPRSFLPSAFGLDCEPNRRAQVEDSHVLVCRNCIHTCDSCGLDYYYEESASDCCGADCPICDTRHYSEEEARNCCNSGSVRNYSYRPLFQFWSLDSEGQAEPRRYAISGELYLGAELELEQALSGSRQFLEDSGEEADGAPDFCYLKEDGSLSSTGVELVTMPCTYGAMRVRFPWQALDNWRSNGARSYRYDSCGLHIHVSRSAFTAPELWRFVKWQLHNSEFCQFVAQRPGSTYARWSERGRIEEDSYSLPDFVKGKDSNSSRYVAINFQNSQTVELRYFKGNVKRESLLAKFGFIDSLYRFTKALTVADCANGALRNPEPYLTWLSATGETRELYSELLTYLRDGGY